MAAVDSVKRALRALATRTDTARPPCVAVVDEAHAALDDVERAAAFVDAVGLARLDAAIEESHDLDATEAVERGTEAMDAYREFRRVAADGDGTTAVSTDSQTGVRDDHIHPAHGTHKRGDCQDSIQ